MGDRAERHLEVHKAHIEWLLVLACLVHQYSEIRDLISCPPALSESCLFICNFRFGLYSDPLRLGSVTAENCAELARQPDVDGFIEAVTHQWAVLASLSWVCVCC